MTRRNSRRSFGRREEETEEVERVNDDSVPDADDRSSAVLSSDGSGGDESGSEEVDEGESASEESSSNSQEGSNDDVEEEEKDLRERQRQATNKVEITSSTTSSEPCTFDLRNLLAMNTHQVDVEQLYCANKTSVDNAVTLPASSYAVNEAFLARKAHDSCTQLIAALWQLPMHRTDVGPMVTLPAYDESRIPRALPPPPPRKETKWEQYAKEKGITNTKRSQKVWDETEQDWKFRHGYNKANNDTKEWPIMEVKTGDDPYADPWEQQRERKRTRTEKNLASSLRNQERAGELATGTTRRVVSSRDKARRVGTVGGGALDRPVAVLPPIGVPVDLQPARDDSARPSVAKLRGKESITKALSATQRSTASMGQFDKMREGEPERKKSTAKKSKDKATAAAASSSEHDRQMKLLQTVVEGGGGNAKEKARRKGQLATGETAYDYDYNDGLGASSFRKRKGRAGAGKARKMTKKRAK